MVVCQSANGYLKNGASGDISKPDEDDFNPMYYACENDHFPVCRWLYDMGAVEHIKADES